MSSQDIQDTPSANSGFVYRRDILLASASVSVASGLGSTALMQLGRAHAQIRHFRKIIRRQRSRLTRRWT